MTKFIKHTLLFVFFSILFFELRAEEEKKWFAEIKVGCFLPTDSKFRETVHDNAIVFEGEINYKWGKNWGVWLSATYYNDNGKETYTKNKIKTKFIPIGFGLKYFHDLNDKVDLYLGAGVNWYFLEITEKSTILPYKIKETGWGPIIKGGVLYDLNEEWFLDLYAEWFYASYKEPGHKTKDSYNEPSTVYGRNYNIGGFILGVGLGYRF